MSRPPPHRLRWPGFGSCATERWPRPAAVRLGRIFGHCALKFAVL